MVAEEAEWEADMVEWAEWEAGMVEWEAWEAAGMLVSAAAVLVLVLVLVLVYEVLQLLLDWLQRVRFVLGLLALEVQEQVVVEAFMVVEGEAGMVAVRCGVGGDSMVVGTGSPSSGRRSFCCPRVCTLCPGASC